jgi:hypothetical protein
MAKRFTDTDKWKREWFCDLPLKAKVVWFYLLDQCDHRGVWFRNFVLMASQVGFKVTERDLREWFGDKLTTFDGDKYWIKSFVDFQYGELNPSNNAHKSVLSLVEKVSKKEPLNSPSGGAQDKDKDKDKEPVLGADPENLITPRLLVEIWNSTCGSLPKCQDLTDTRKAKAKAQIAKYPDVAHWRAALAAFLRSDFCLNEWRPGFDSWLEESKRLKAIEGQYENKKKGRAINYGVNTTTRAEEPTEPISDSDAKAAIAKMRAMGVKLPGDVA